MKYGGHCLRYGLTLVGKNYLFFLHIMEDTAPDNVFRIRSIHAPERAVLAEHLGSLHLNRGRMSDTKTTNQPDYSKWGSKLQVFFHQPLQWPQLVRTVKFDRLVVWLRHEGWAVCCDWSVGFYRCIWPPIGRQVYFLKQMLLLSFRQYNCHNYGRHCSR